MKRIIFAALGTSVLLVLASLNPAGWQFFGVALILIAYALAPYINLQSRLLRFVLILCSGLLVEFFAWLNNYLAQTPQPALFHPILWANLLIGIFFYSSWALAWNFVEKKWGLRLKDVIIMTAIYAICIEQLGKVLLSFNVAAYIFVALVYLSVILPAFLLVKPLDKPVLVWKRYVYGLLVLAIFSLAGTHIFAAPFYKLIPAKPSVAGY